MSQYCVPLTMADKASDAAATQNVHSRIASVVA